MAFKFHQSQVRLIKSSDPRFIIKDRFVVAPRAGFEIDPQCPANYAQVILECIDRGWLKPVANMTERELLFLGLASNE